MFRASFLASVAALSLISTPLAAQSNTAAIAQRDAVFQQMLADPANRQLMAEFARLSVEMRDFEAAASTLERLVDLEPTNTTARVELAIAYFALGSYTVAEYHLTAAAASGALSPDQVAQVGRYLEESAERDQPSNYSGRVEAGYAFTDTGGDTGAFASAELDWRIDLGDAHATQWVTEFGFSTFRPDETSVNDRVNARLRSGPEFRIARDAYGPRLQPYIELGLFNANDTVTEDFTTWALGLAYTNPVNERITVYSDLSYGQEIDSAGSADYEFTELDLGITYRPSRDTRLRLSGTWANRDQIADTAAPISTTAASFRLTAQHAFDPAFNTLPNRWVVGAFAEAGEMEQVQLFADDITIEDQRYGAWLRAFVVEDIYIEGSASRIMRDTRSTFFTSETEETIYTLQIGWEF